MRFSIPSIALLSLIPVCNAVHAQDEKKADGLKTLYQFVGVWNNEVNNKPAKWIPEGGKRTVRECTTKILKDQFILGREISQPGDGKMLWLKTYNAKTNTYPFVAFTNTGLYGGEWSSTWDAAAKKFTGKATDTPEGWTSSGSNHFPDANTNNMQVWMKDDAGTLLMDAAGTKKRQPDETGAKVIADWSKIEKTKTPLPEELKILERTIGTWETVNVSKPAVWNPKETKTTSKVKRKWVLDGHFLMDESESSDGNAGVSLTTFDPNMKKFRAWWFGSDGNTNKSTGEWDAAKETMTYKTDLDDSLTGVITLQFMDKDNHVWKMTVKDGDGKLYFDMTWTVTRRKQ